MYQKVNTDLNFVAREKEVRRFWEEEDIFRKSMKQREGCPVYTFYDGPPTANGKPHIGHVLTRVIKDMIPRYRTMKGYYVPRKAGWDTHGLPVELEVEKRLGLNGKDQIESYGMEPFIKECKESVWQYKGMWEDFSGTVGFWADMEHPYITYDDDFIESEWWALSEIWDKGLLYKGFKVVPYCPRCGTPLSAQEVAQGYKTVKERSAVVRFKAADEDAWFLAWTTTPWTLPSNVALCVNPDEAYLKARAADGYTYYLAKALADTVLGALTEGTDEDAYEILAEMNGRELEGRSYEPLYTCAAERAEKQHKRAHFITCDGYVTMSDGTGIVHIAPAFGEDDARIGRAYDLPFVQFVDESGHMTGETPFAGLFVKDADPEVIKELSNRKQLFSAPKFEHDYPHCWRCDTPLIYYARESWFIRMTAVKEQLIKNNNTVNWIPESIGKGRFGDWLENVQDWGISRNRYWGTPLNIWECEGCGRQEAVRSRAALAERSQDAAAAKLELHRPYIDSVTFSCPDCGGTMHRVPEVVDCWFDSGAMPFAQHHYPFENEDLFRQQFPAQFISEAVDQTRGWFYSLMAESTLLFDRAPYENVVVLGHVQDEHGQKMSKSKGNAVDPFEALERYGADAIRWYFYINSAPWLPNRFHGKAVEEGQRRFMGTLWNTYAFYVLYAEIDRFDPTKHTLDRDSLQTMDRWILSRLQAAVSAVDDDLAHYRIPEAARELESFTDDLSNWYVRRSRERFWAPGMEQDKINAYMTLYTALVTLAKMAAPMIPFMADEIYRNLVAGLDAPAPESVHLCDFPEADESLRDEALEEAMREVLSLVVFGRAARNVSGMKNRQPLAAMYVRCPRGLSDSDKAILADELNVKAVFQTEDVSAYTTYEFKPQLKTVGPKYGRFLKQIQAALSELDGNAAYAALQTDGFLSLSDVDESIRLAEEDLLITMRHQEGFVTDGDNVRTVVLDIRLTPELVEEGLVRELESKIQTMRKEAGFEVTDHIRLVWQGTPAIDSVFDRWSDIIGRDVLADEIVRADDLSEPKTGAYARDWSVNGEDVRLSVQRI